MATYHADKLAMIELGRQGENLARTVEIDVSSMLAQWPQASITLLVKRRHDATPYIANTSVVDGILIWPITATETEVAGEGKIEIRATCGEVLAKSAIGTIRVITSLTGSEATPPAAVQGWVDAVIEAGTRAVTSASDAEAARIAAESAAQEIASNTQIAAQSAEQSTESAAAAQQALEEVTRQVESVSMEQIAEWLIEHGYFSGAAVLSAAHVRDISAGWTFTMGSQSRTVDLPHSCNADESMMARYYRGETSYEKSINIPAGNVSMLFFEGAGTVADVYVNDELIASHKGGYVPFAVMLNDMEKGMHRVRVVCDNRLNADVIPISADFNFANGLYRRAWLISVPSAAFDAERYGMDRMHVAQEAVSADSAILNVAAEVASAVNRTATVTFRLKDAEGTAVETVQTETELTAGQKTPVSAEFSLAHPHLWNGLADPYLYTVEAVLTAEETTLDTVAVRTGLRFFEIDHNRGFLLNGNVYPLRGVCMHQDAPNGQAAATDEEIETDFEFIRDIGANYLRMAHYPHSKRLYELCDEWGVIVQTEIPWVNQCGEDASDEYFANIKTNMAEMVRNYFNHPCVVFWGMSNELGNNTMGSADPQGAYDREKALAWMNELAALTRVQDPSRKVGFTATWATYAGDDNLVNYQVDWIAMNHYEGWYSGTFSDFGRAIDGSYHRFHTIMVGEYGAGGDPFTHSQDPAATTNTGSGGARHDEEYENLFHEAYIEQIQARPWLPATSLWVLFDFYVSARHEGGMLYTNDKGLITRDRQTRKDVFYLYKALWKDTPVAYISSRRFVNREAGSTVIKAYANTDALTLKIDGEAVQTLTEPTSCGVVWTFDVVEMSNGSHAIEISGSRGGEVVTDSVQWSFTMQVDPLVVTAHPQDAAVEVGQRASFSVEVSGGTPPYSYQWQWANTTGDFAAASSDSSSGQEANFSTSPRTLVHNGFRYRCVITDAANVTVVSEAATIAVTESAVTVMENPLNGNNVAYVPVPSLTENATLYIKLADRGFVGMRQRSSSDHCLITTKSPVETTGIGKYQVCTDDAAGAIGGYYVRGTLLDSPSVLQAMPRSFAVQASENNRWLRRELFGNSLLIHKNGCLTGNDTSLIWGGNPDNLNVCGHKGYLYINCTGNDLPTNEPSSYTTNAALTEAVQNGDIGRGMSNFKIDELIVYADAHYESVAEVQANAASADVWLRFDATGKPYNAGSSGDFVYSELTE